MEAAVKEAEMHKYAAAAQYKLSIQQQDPEEDK